MSSGGSSGAVTPAERILPPARPGSKSGWRTAGGGVLVFLLLLLPTLLLQRLSGAYGAELDGYPDEPAHFITSLMVRDYIVAGLPAHPIQYAENYYLHYPKVAFGMWGPLFHIIGGLWLLPSPSRTAILLLMAVITAGLATTLYQLVRKEFSVEAGMAAALALIAVPAVQSGTNMVMGDILCALLDLWACIYFARYLDKQRTRDAMLFGFAAALSILAKPSGLALALLPPLGIFLTGRGSWIRTRAFWYPAIIVAVVCGPWQLLEYHLLSGMHRETRLVWALVLLRYIARMLGSALVPVAVLGILVKFVPRLRTAPARPIWAAAGTMALAVWLYHFVLPVGATEMRYMIPVLPPLLMFVMAGIYWIAGRVGPQRVAVRWRAAALIVAAGLVFAVQTFAIPRKLPRGFEAAAQAMAARPDWRDAVFLVSSESDGEGLLISEIAMRDAARPGHIILRAGKVLGQSDWQSKRYKLLYTTPQAIMQYLDSIPVHAVVVDRSPAWFRTEHQPLLLQALQMYPQHCRLWGTFPRDSAGAAPGSRVEVYELLGQPQRPPGKIRIDMPYTWGKPIGN